MPAPAFTSFVDCATCLRPAIFVTLGAAGRGSHHRDAGAATPMREAAAHDADDSWLRFRRACHARIREYLTRVHDGVPPEKAYWATYDALGRRGKVHSEEEDPATFRGGFYRAVVKMFD